MVHIIFTVDLAPSTVKSQNWHTKYMTMLKISAYLFIYVDLINYNIYNYLKVKSEEGRVCQYGLFPAGADVLSVRGPK